MRPRSARFRACAAVRRGTRQISALISLAYSVMRALRPPLKSQMAAGIGDTLPTLGALWNMPVVGIIIARTPATLRARASSGATLNTLTTASISAPHSIDSGGRDSASLITSHHALNTSYDGLNAMTLFTIGLGFWRVSRAISQDPKRKSSRL